MRALLRVGLAPTGTYLLTVRGRRTGTPHSTPVTLVEREDGRWLVAPYGAVGWVHNARSAGRVRLSRGRRCEDLEIEEVSGEEAAGVLQTYVRNVRIVRPYFDASAESPVGSSKPRSRDIPFFGCGLSASGGADSEYAGERHVDTTAHAQSRRGFGARHRGRRRRSAGASRRCPARRRRLCAACG